MVPSPYSSHLPCFPGCIDWLVDNQLINGSWSPNHNGHVLIKDALSSTLASVLALKQWGIGEEHVNKGLKFIESNITSAIDENLSSPIGFEIIFPNMIRSGEELGLNIPIAPKFLDTMISKRELELKRYCFSKSIILFLIYYYFLRFCFTIIVRKCLSEGRSSYLAFISEGINWDSNDWKMVMKHQRKNGSLFNSPSTTAAAFMHLKDADCLNYLRSVTEKFGSEVPVAYPLDIYVRLSMVDHLIRMGIERHFTEEIRSVLDETYRCWLLNDEQIFHDIATNSMAFRLLCLNGYNVSSDRLTRASNEYDFIFPEQHQKTIDDAIELYKALQLTQEKHHLCSSEFLKEKLSNCLINRNGLDKYITQKVNDALEFPFHADVGRMANRRNIEKYMVNHSMLLKASYSSSNIGNEDFLKMAVEEFNTCQYIYREELEKLERWILEYELNKLQFARHRTEYHYISAAMMFPSPHLSHVRIFWVKSAVLTIMFDDFFDVGGSDEELKNLIQLVEKWDVDLATDHCISEDIRILFSVLHDTVCEIGSNAFEFQGRSVTSHIIELWLDLLNSSMQEVIWRRSKSVPTMDDYISYASVTFAMGPLVLPALYFLGSKLSDEVVHSYEMQTLTKLVSTCGRLLNDMKGFERESKEGKLNAVSLYMLERNGEATEEETIENLMGIVLQQRTELLGLVLQQEEGNLIPRACKEVFWKMIQICHIFYAKDDGFTSNTMVNAVKSIIYQPISLPKINDVK
ncbi:terpene synthase 6, chloroplastic-like [Impatiens glandulifera]|uniref:terpene synthase 6, chloroplastic-like n=1 Tax=Impatiens glandulifera TaxID=253017 RepID=UPI001FB0B13E|nr:terpene synthase 6, chloroplastic-like [Impatiens glandulifera]